MDRKNDELVMLAMCLKCTGMKLIDEEDGEDIFDVSLHLWDQQDNGHFKIPMLKRNTDMFKVGNFYSSVAGRFGHWPAALSRCRGDTLRGSLRTMAGPASRTVWP